MTIPYSVFIEELRDELNELEKWGTSYRLETAKYALEIGNHVLEADIFLNRERALTAVKGFNPLLDEERVKDVSELLYHIAKNIEWNYNMTEEQKEMKEQRKQKDETFSVEIYTGADTDSTFCFRWG